MMEATERNIKTKQKTRGDSNRKKLDVLKKTTTSKRHRGEVIGMKQKEGPATTANMTPREPSQREPNQREPRNKSRRGRNPGPRGGNSNREERERSERGEEQRLQWEKDRDKTTHKELDRILTTQRPQPEAGAKPKELHQLQTRLNHITTLSHIPHTPT